ncbi:hypothetical protein [Teichococcus vastitatis]|uniref:Uncharacterized protein n=1 Tax=Teichococcus vastitatis TaxID=2307076 RepID=A0ABS9W8R3_9PROT|nr:hypothetical protein [Pseudoroseomonas vastitatis]MCI0755682.1 hypothetical protein [Pseudoroseomonas vastitatis]
MARFLVVSFQQYRTYHLELRDGGGAQCAVIIHPPADRGEAHEVPQDPEATTLVERIGRAKAMIDVILGPRPPLRAPGQRRQPHAAGF